MPKRVSFLIDGFNLYHSLREVAGVSKASVKWLNVKALCERYLQAVGSGVGERVNLSRVHYFSARPNFLSRTNPDVRERHDLYMDALRSTGVKVELSQFKWKDITCPHCHEEFGRPEEKETDVAIAVTLIDVFARAECDVAVLVTGDTDLIPAVRTAKGLMPRKQVGAAFPVFRHNHELKSVVDFSFNLSQKEIEKSQFPRVVHLLDGRDIAKPLRW